MGEVLLRDKIQQLELDNSYLTALNKELEERYAELEDRYTQVKAELAKYKKRERLRELD